MKLYPYQEDIFCAVFSEELKYHLLIACRQIGKTTIACHLCMHVAAYLMADYCTFDRTASSRFATLKTRAHESGEIISVNYIMPFYDQAMRTAWETMTAEIRRFRSENCGSGGEYEGLDIKISTSRRVIELDYNGREGLIKFTGLDRNPEAVRGNTAHFVVCDEIAQLDPYDLTTVVEPTLSATGGPILYCGTAHSSVELKRTYAKMLALEKKGESTITMMDIDKALNERIIDQKRYKECLAIYGGDKEDPVYQMEFMCNMNVQVSGSIFGHWKKVITPVTGSVIDYEGYISMDIGFRSRYVVMIWLRHRHTGRIVLERILSYTEVTTDDITADVAKHYPGMKFTVYVPHDGTRASGVTSKTEFTVWQEAECTGRALNMPQKYKNAVLSVAECIRLARRNVQMFHISEGIDKLSDDFGQLMDYHFKDGSDEPLKDNITDHYGDAFRYGIRSLIIFRKVGTIDKPFNVHKGTEGMDQLQLKWHYQEMAKLTELKEAYKGVPFRDKYPVLPKKAEG